MGPKRRHVALVGLCALLVLASRATAQQSPAAAAAPLAVSSPGEPATRSVTATNVAELLAERERWSAQRVSLAGPTTLIVLGAATTLLGAILFRQRLSYDCAVDQPCPSTRAFPEASKALLITGALSVAAGVTWFPFRRARQKTQTEALDRIDAELREAAPQLSALPVLAPRAAAPAGFIGLVAAVQL